MASRLYKQFVTTNNAGLTYVEGSFTIGASGAVAPSTAIVGSGVLGVTKTGTGQYQVQLQDNFNRLLGFDVNPFSPTSAAGPITDGSLVIGNPYQIVFASTSTNWYTLGLPKGVIPTAGMPFVATSGASNGPLGSSGVTAAGNGTVIRIGNSGIASCETLPNPNTILFSNNANGPLGSSSIPPQGGFIMFQTLNGSGVPTSPTSGTVLRFNAFLRNSSLLGTNETPGNF
jgi:hypothetical protein